MKKLISLALAALAALATMSGVAFAHPIHDGTSAGAILASHNSNNIAIIATSTGGSTQIIAAQSTAVALSSKAEKDVAISAAANRFPAVASIVMADVTVEVTYEPKFPAMAMSQRPCGEGRVVNKWERGSYAAASLVSFPVFA